LGNQTNDDGPTLPQSCGMRLVQANWSTTTRLGSKIGPTASRSALLSTPSGAGAVSWQPVYEVGSLPSLTRREVRVQGHGDHADRPRGRWRWETGGGGAPASDAGMRMDGCHFKTWLLRRRPHSPKEAMISAQRGLRAKIMPVTRHIGDEAPWRPVLNEDLVLGHLRHL
jgi:hypothetical protein